MNRYQDNDGAVWVGPNDNTLFLRGKGGRLQGAGVSRSHIERQVGKLTSVEEKK